VHLTLLVPELIWPEPADPYAFEKLAAPGCAWLLARARGERSTARPFERVLAAGFGLDDAPLAALRLLGEGSEQARDGHWLCADPVHLRFHQERIVLADAGAFDLDADESATIVASLNAAFADIGTFHQADARRWYLRLAAAVDHPAEPLSAVAGRRVDGRLPDSDRPLVRWLNEVQMFLHGHPVNAAREAAGKPAVNSLWLWGGGPLPTPATGYSAVFSGNPLAGGLARAAGLPLAALPATLGDLPAAAGDRPLVVLDQLLPRVLYEDSEGWRVALEQLDADWLAPLGKALGKQVDRASIVAPTIYGELRYELSAGDRWKFWKNTRSLASTAQELAR
jgi:hypothetical protein